MAVGNWHYTLSHLQCPEYQSDRAEEIESDDMPFEKWLVCLMLIRQDYQPFQIPRTTPDS
jgi:hypothetical protein